MYGATGPLRLARHAFGAVLLIVAVGAAGCSKDGAALTGAASASPAASGAPEAQTKTARLVVSMGSERLGVFELAPGKPGVLTLESASGSAEKLKQVCDAINAKESVFVDVESRPKQGHYVHESRGARRGSAGYPDAVHMKLASEGFKVERQ